MKDTIPEAAAVLAAPEVSPLDAVIVNVGVTVMSIVVGLPLLSVVEIVVTNDDCTAALEASFAGVLACPLLNWESPMGKAIVDIGVTVSSILLGLPLLSVMESVVTMPEGIGVAESPIVGIRFCPLELTGEAAVLGMGPLPPTNLMPSGAAAERVGDKVDAMTLTTLEPESMAAIDAALARILPAEVT